MAINSKRDMDKLELCVNCEKKFPRHQLRGTNNGDWLCEADWEEKHGSPPPPTTPFAKRVSQP